MYFCMSRMLSLPAASTYAGGSFARVRDTAIMMPRPAIIRHEIAMYAVANPAMTRAQAIPPMRIATPIMYKANDIRAPIDGLSTNPDCTHACDSDSSAECECSRSRTPTEDVNSVTALDWAASKAGLFRLLWLWRSDAEQRSPFLLAQHLPFRHHQIA